jgi:hypothetical protein
MPDRAYRPLYPPWTALLITFFLLVACLATFAHEEYGVAVVVGLCAGFFAGIAVTKELYRRLPPWLNTVMGEAKSPFGSLSEVIRTERERDALRAENERLRESAGAVFATDETLSEENESLRKLVADMREVMLADPGARYYGWDRRDVLTRARDVSP